MSRSWKLLKRACELMALQRSSGQRTSHLSAPPPSPRRPPTHLCTLPNPPSLLPLRGGSIYWAVLATLPPSVSFMSAFPLPKGQVRRVSVAPSSRPFCPLFFPPLILCSVSFFEGKVLCEGLRAGQAAMLHTGSREWMGWLLGPCGHSGSAREPVEWAALSLPTLTKSDGNEITCYGF